MSSPELDCFRSHFHRRGTLQGVKSLHFYHMVIRSSGSSSTNSDGHEEKITELAALMATHPLRSRVKVDICPPGEGLSDTGIND